MSNFLDPDFSATIAAGNEALERERRSQDEADVAAILREALIETYGEFIQEPKELARNSVISYTKAFAEFAKYCKAQACPPEIEAPRSLPARPELVAAYLHSLIQSGAKVDSLRVASAAIRRAHRLKGLADPCDDVLVAGILRAAREMARLDAQDSKKKPATNGHAKEH